MSDVGSVRTYGDTGGITVNTPYEDKNKQLSIDDFLQLMIAQMKNVDFMGEGGGGGADSGQMVTQLAQISAMQEMQNLAYYSKTNYVMSMVGKEVTVAQLGIGGSVSKDTGLVEKISLDGNDFLLYVNGKGYKLNEIMSVNNPESVVDEGLQGIKKSEVVVMGTSDSMAHIRWDKPTQDKDVLDKLTYSVYYSTNSNMDSVADVKKNGLLSGEEKQKDLYMAKIEELDPNTTYYVNVVVTAADGREYIYKKSTFKTDP